MGRNPHDGEQIRTTILLHEQDHEVLNDLIQRLGLGSTSAAIRFIIRDWAQAKQPQAAA